jgi:hypothetical protein
MEVIWRSHIYFYARANVQIKWFHFRMDSNVLLGVLDLTPKFILSYLGHFLRCRILQSNLRTLNAPVFLKARLSSGLEISCWT